MNMNENMTLVESLDSLRKISCSMEIVMRDMIEDTYKMERDYIEIEEWEVELERFIGRGVVDGWKEINRVIDALEKLKKYDA